MTNMKKAGLSCLSLGLLMCVSTSILSCSPPSIFSAGAYFKIDDQFGSCGNVFSYKKNSDTNRKSSGTLCPNDTVCGPLAFGEQYVLIIDSKKCPGTVPYSTQSYVLFQNNDCGNWVFHQYLGTVVKVPSALNIPSKYSTTVAAAKQNVLEICVVQNHNPSSSEKKPYAPIVHINCP